MNEPTTGDLLQSVVVPSHAEVALQAEPKPPTPIRPPRSGFSYRSGWRSRWHRTVGWLLIVVGAAVIILNAVAWVGVDVMPGGRSELYLLLGLLVAGFGSWWTGLYDRPSPTPASQCP